MITYNYCPECGTKMDNASEPPHCTNCGQTFYRNPKVCVSILPVKDGQVLLGIRGRDPFKGAYDIVGGFMEIGETPEDGAVREGKEETNLDLEVIQLLGTYVDTYGEGGDFTLNLHYVARVVGGELRAQDDSADVLWVDIDKVPLDSGFQNTRDGLRDLQVWYANQRA